MHCHSSKNDTALRSLSLRGSIPKFLEPHCNSQRSTLTSMSIPCFAHMWTTPHAHVALVLSHTSVLVTVRATCMHPTKRRAS